MIAPFLKQLSALACRRADPEAEKDAAVNCSGPGNTSRGRNDPCRVGFRSLRWCCGMSYFCTVEEEERLWTI